MQQYTCGLQTHGLVFQRNVHGLQRRTAVAGHTMWHAQVSSSGTISCREESIPGEMCSCCSQSRWNFKLVTRTCTQPQPVDVWAAAVILFVLMLSEFPFIEATEARCNRFAAAARGIVCFVWCNAMIGLFMFNRFHIDCVLRGLVHPTGPTCRASRFN